MMNKLMRTEMLSRLTWEQARLQQKDVGLAGILHSRPCVLKTAEWKQAFANV